MRKILLISVISFVLFSCTEDFVTKDPIGTLSNTTLYENPNNCELAVNAIYDPLGWEKMYQVGMFAIGDVASDDTEKGGGNNVSDYPNDQSDMYPISTHSVTPLNSYISTMWESSYIGIARANEMIFRTKDLVSGDNEDLYKRMRGEARFLRAFYYFDMVRIWGPVPLIKEPLPPLEAENVGNRVSDDDTDGDMQMEEIYSFIIEELEAIKEDLPVSYDDDNAGRVTAGAVKALLAKAYLYKADIFGNNDNEYEKSFLLAQEVIDDDVYELEENYQEVFSLNLENEYSDEFVFSIQFKKSSKTLRNGEGSIKPLYTSARLFYTSSNNVSVEDTYGYGFNMPRQDLVDEFDSKDPRLDMIIAENDSLFCDATTSDPSWARIAKTNFSTGYYNLKGTANWDKLDRSQSVGKNIPVIRLAEVYLIAAEAGFKDGNYTNEALTYVNKIRERARQSSDYNIETVRSQFQKNRENVTIDGDHPPVDLSSITLDDIRLERRLELYGEGHRYFDLIRWSFDDDKYGEFILTNMTADVVGNPITFNPATEGRMPIPQTQINLHTGGNLKQNPGY
ncbi:MAG: RagB/SusD family nutrient uptake outer membrane protein [Bacteroidales bacterium]